MDEVLKVLLVLTNLSTALMRATQKVTELIEEANAEGRDLTDEEVASVRAEGDKAIAEWNDLVSKLD